MRINSVTSQSISFASKKDQKTLDKISKYAKEKKLSNEYANIVKKHIKEDHVGSIRPNSYAANSLLLLNGAALPFSGQLLETLVYSLSILLIGAFKTGAVQSTRRSAAKLTNKLAEANFSKAAQKFASQKIYELDGSKYIGKILNKS